MMIHGARDDHGLCAQRIAELERENAKLADALSGYNSRPFSDTDVILGAVLSGGDVMRLAKDLHEKQHRADAGNGPRAASGSTGPGEGAAMSGSEHGTYRVEFVSHTGMAMVPLTGLDLSEARAAVARIIRRRRRSGHRVMPLAPMWEEVGRWEVCEPDGATLVPDTAGILTMAMVWDVREDGDDGTDV